MSPLFLMIRTRAAFAGDNREYRIRACLKKALERQVGKMSRKEEYEQKAEALLSPIVESNGFELVDVEYVKEAGNWYLRGYIDKPGGITVNDCETVSRAFSDRLDEDDFIEDSYIMEISSPGLDRPLKKEKDFARSIVVPLFNVKETSSTAFTAPTCLPNIPPLIGKYFLRWDTSRMLSDC